MNILVCALTALTVFGIELTPSNWDKETAGKTVFIKFLAPWWGHCKKMKPAWDRLMKQFKGSETALIADVDCTADGKELCTKVGVKGYPTLKYGDPNNLEDYKGGREYNDLLSFAKENLGPSCGPEHMDLCNADEKAKIEAIQAKGLTTLKAEIKELDDIIKNAEEHFDTELKKLQETYEQLQKDKDAAVEAAKGKDLGLMKTVRAFLQSQADKEHDEL